MREFSTDGLCWEKIPKHVTVFDSKYALLFGSLSEVEFSINLNEFEVAVGNSCGVAAHRYLRYRVDKACVQRAVTTGKKEPPTSFSVSFSAELVAPHAVLLR